MSQGSGSNGKASRNRKSSSRANGKRDETTANDGNIQVVPSSPNVSRYQLQAGQVVRLAEWNPRDANSFDGDKASGKWLLEAMTKRLKALQEVFYAQHQQRLLIVLQAMDTGGKDSTVSHVFSGVNPQGIKVISFKSPTQDELAHDFLWRVHPHVPGNGEIVIFNRSHYEDVLIVRVHELISEQVVQRRYEHINAFETMLHEEGTTLLKFFLHISKEEQKERLQARLDDPTKHWKFQKGDLAERARWDDYIRAYEDMLTHTSTAYAPWHIIPADRKWYRNLVVSQTIINTLEGLDLRYPEAEEGLDQVVIE